MPGRDFIGAAIAGALLACVAPAAELSPLRVGANGRGLVDPANRPVFLLGDTAWSLALRASREDAEHYLGRRISQGFNAVTFVLFAPGRTELTGEVTNHYGDAPFENAGGRPEPAQRVTTPGADPRDAQQYDYWDHVDYIVALARRAGLYAILLPTWGSGLVGSYDGKDARDVVFDPESARDYGTWLGRRYGGEPHVLWMMGGDRSAVNGERDARPVIRALAAAIAAAAPAQLMSYHPRKGAPQSAEWFHGDAWLAFNSIQEWPDQQLRHIAADWARQPAKPTWLFEGRYEGYWKGNYKPGDWGGWQIRQQAYQTVFGGAFGHIYGHERVFGFGYDKVDWKLHLDSPGARSMTHLAGLMALFTPGELLGRQPDPGMIDGDPGKPERLQSNYLAATRDASGVKAMIYSASGRAIRLRMERLAPGRFFGFWFNPREGTWQRDGQGQQRPVAFARDVKGGPGAPVHEFTPPTQGAGEDWVLVLSARESLN